MILNHMLNVMLDFAIKAHDGQMPSEDDYVEHVFRVIYRSIEQYFKEEVKEIRQAVMGVKVKVKDE